MKWAAGTFPRAVAVLTPPVALLATAAGRLALRVLRERVAPNPDAERISDVQVASAGTLGWPAAASSPRCGPNSPRRAYPKSTSWPGE